MPINRFRGEYFFLSNFFPCREGVTYDGDVFPTSEHAYQAAKIEEAEGRKSFICGGSLGDNPMDAKTKGGKVKKRPNWERIKVDVMLEVVRSKFARDSDLQQKLLSTQNQQIVEGHTGDKFWGGKANHLGNILKRVRDELRMQHRQAATQTIMEDNADDTYGKPKQRSKGDSGRQSLFQDQLKTWTDTDKSSTAEGAACDEEATGVRSKLSSDPVVETIDVLSVGSAGDNDQGILPSGFVAWLRSALKELSDTNAESLMCSVEFILGAPLEDLSEALENVSELFSQEGVSITKEELEVQWAIFAAK
jgi:ribA/ribD-fused uncharacterized protein